MLESVRARLAMWHTGVLAILLTSFALAAYVFLEHSTVQHAEEYLSSAASGFSLELVAERRDATSDSAAIANAVAEFRTRDLGVAVLDQSGRVLTLSSGDVFQGQAAASSHSARQLDKLAAVQNPVPAPDLGTLARAVRSAHAQQSRALILQDGEGGYRVLTIPIRLAPGRYTVAMVQSRHAEQETLEAARTASLIAIPIMLLAAGIGGSFLAKRSLAPVAAMTERAAQISAANLSERLPAGNPRDELGGLARVLNELLSRVDAAFEQQRRFMADASHELRTPVSIMRAEAEVALSVDLRPPASYRESLGVIGDTAARLSTVVNELFLLARADAGQQPLRRGALYLGDLVSECVRSVRALALRSGVTVRLSSEIDAPFEGDDELLRRLFTNLLDNAVKYSGKGATVFVTVSETQDFYRIGVRDTGPGIPEPAQPHLFERFFRADVARSRATSVTDSPAGGAGLGLAIAQWVADAHGGRVELAQSSASGTEFVVWLPRQREAA